jgi:hypothetical protein
MVFFFFFFSSFLTKIGKSVACGKKKKRGNSVFLVMVLKNAQIIHGEFKYFFLCYFKALSLHLRKACSNLAQMNEFKFSACTLSDRTI